MLLSLLLTVALLPEVDLSEVRQALEEGRYAEAESSLTPLLGTDDDRQVRMLLAEARLGQGRGLDAFEILDPLLAAQDAEVQHLAGRTLIAAGDELLDSGASWTDGSYYYEMALENLTLAASLGSRQAALDGGYLALYDLYDASRARDFADAAGKQHPKDGEVTLLSGCVRVREYVEADPEDAKAALALWKQAVEDLERAAEQLGEKRGEPYYQLQWLYQARGLAEEAIEAACMHHDRTPGDDLSTLFLLALRYATERDYYATAMAIAAMTKRNAERYGELIAAQEDPKATALNLSWAASEPASKGRNAEALAILKPLAVFEPDDVSFWNNLGFFSRELAQYEESYTAYERALTYDDTSPRLLNDTALILQYYLRRDLERAQLLYERAIVLAEEGLAAGAEGEEAAELSLALTDARDNLRRMTRRR